MAVYRVHWLKAKARRDRWLEERTLLSNEMDWAVAFFKTQATSWDVRAASLRTIGSEAAQAGRSNLASTPGDRSRRGADGPGDGPSVESPHDRGEPSLRGLGDVRGHLCYASRQQMMWLKFADLAANQFSKSKSAVCLN